MYLVSEQARDRMSGYKPGNDRTVDTALNPHGYRRANGHEVTPVDFGLGRAEKSHHRDHHMEPARWSVACSVPLGHPWSDTLLGDRYGDGSESKEPSASKATRELSRHGVLRRGEDLRMSPLGYALVSESIDVINRENVWGHRAWG